MHCSHQDLEESARTLLELRVILRLKNQHRSCQTSSAEPNFCLLGDGCLIPRCPARLDQELAIQVRLWLSCQRWQQVRCCTSQLSSTSFHMTRFTGSQFCGKIIAYEIRSCFEWNPIQYSMNMYWRSLVQIPSWSREREREQVRCQNFGNDSMNTQKHLGWEGWLFSFFCILIFTQDSRTESSCLFCMAPSFGTSAPSKASCRTCALRCNAADSKATRHFRGRIPWWLTIQIAFHVKKLEI